MRPRLGVYIVLIVSLAAGCGHADRGSKTLAATPAASATTPAPKPRGLLSITFEAGLTNMGSADVKVTPVSINGGHLNPTPGPDGGRAMRFPAYSASSKPPRAVIAVRSKSSTDAFNPGTHEFSYGADFRLDTISSGSPDDDGDNLLQRGLFVDPVQFKVQLDKRTPSCLVKGSEGRVIVKAPVKVDAASWYHVECHRMGSKLTMRLGKYDTKGNLAVVSSFTAVGAIGDVTMTDPGTPLAIGGKLSHQGLITSSETDQFNGGVDNVFYHVER